MAAADASSDQSVPSLKLKPRGDGGGGGEDSKIIAAESISSSREKKPWGPSRVSLRSRSSSSDASLSLLVQEEDAGDQQSSRNLWQVPRASHLLLLPSFCFFFPPLVLALHVVFLVAAPFSRCEIWLRFCSSDLL